MNIMNDPLIIGTQLSNELGGNDAKLWESLFIASDKINPDFASRLMYMRNSGCRLQKHDKFGYMIHSIKSYWESDEFYKQEKQCLIPFKDELITLLGGI